MTVAKPVDVEARSAAPPFRRVLLKLSGEALMGSQEYGLDPRTVDGLAKELVHLRADGIEVALVVGGSITIPHLRRAVERLDEILEG